MLIRIVDSRWFALADLALVSISIILWEIEPGFGWFPLLIALLPWGLRVLAGRFPFQRTPFDLLLLVFLVTAALGVWAAYDTAGAWAKFWLLIGAVLMYYAFAGQPEENFGILAFFLSLVGVGGALFFFFTHNWELQPANMGFLNQIGLRWMAVRPTPGLNNIFPNDAGGLFAMMAPLIALTAVGLWRKDNSLLRGAIVLLCGWVFGIFLLTTSRGAWLAFAIMIGTGLLWWLTGRLFEVQFKRKMVFGIALIVFLGVGVWVLVTDAITVPGLKPIGQESFQGATRLELVQGGLDLAGDFPITGGGLETFPGLYSQYIMETPFFLILFAHNIFVDAAIEQGVLGALAMVWVLFGSIWLLAKRLGSEAESPFVLAILGCLLVMIVHNMLDNLVYYTLSAPLLFILPGFAVAVARAGDPQDAPSRAGGAGRWRIAAVGTVVLVILLTGAWFRQPLAATWYAGLGAVQMSKVQLADFPSGAWDTGGDVERFAAVETLFLTALAYDPENRTANHRLGLIAMLEHDFQRAVSHLEIALQADPEHRGIRKALGYSYTWTGQYAQAFELLADLPEVIQEMDVYIWWWGKLGRDDLAGNAKEMLTLLASAIMLPDDGADTP